MREEKKQREREGESERVVYKNDNNDHKRLMDFNERVTKFHVAASPAGVLTSLLCKSNEA